MRLVSPARITIPLAVALLATSCSMNPYTARATENITVDYQPATPVHVTTRNGSIQVLGGAIGPEIQVQATITACGSTQE